MKRIFSKYLSNTLELPLCCLCVASMLLLLLVGTENAWGGNCTFTTNYGGTSATAYGKWNSYQGFGNINLCTTDASLKIVSISMTVSMDGSGADKGFKGTLKASDGTTLKSNFEVSRGSSANCSANVNKSGISSFYFTTSNTYSKTRTVTISNIVVTYEYAASLSASNITMENTPKGGSSQKTITVEYQNSTDGSFTLSAAEQSDANGYFSISPTSKSLSGCSGSTTFTVTFSPTAPVNGATATYRFSGNGSTKDVTVTGTAFNVVDPTITCSIASEYYVDDSDLDLSKLWTSNNNVGAITYSKVSFSESGKNNSVRTDPDVASDGKTLALRKAGTLVIKMHQAASTGYNEYEATKTITIKKRSNSLSCSLGNFTKNMNLDEEAGVTFSATNTDYTNSPISITQNSGGSIATYSSGNHKFNSNHNTGTATWTIAQEENYKYVGASTTFTVNVNIDNSNSCNVLDNQSNTVDGWHGNTYHEHTWSAENAAGVVRFEISKTSGIDQGYKVQQLVNGIWTDVTDYKNDHSTSWGDWKTETLNRAAKGVRFMLKGGSLNHVRNVSVSRNKYIETKNTSGTAITSLAMPSKAQSGAATSTTFYVDYSTCDDVIKLASDNPHITFANGTTSCQFTPDNTGRKAIELTYSSNAEENIETSITIYTPHEHKTLTVTAQTLGKLATHLVYKGQTSYNVDVANIAATDLFEVRDANNDVISNPTITLSTDNSTIIAIAGSNNQIDPGCGGKTTVYASYLGDNNYAAASNNGLGQEITINRLADEVSINNGKSVIVKGDVFDLSTWGLAASSQSEDSEYSYESTNTNLFTVSPEGVLTAVNGGGSADLIVRTSQTCSYSAGETRLTIKVRNPEDPCESLLLDKSETVKCGMYYRNSSDPQYYDIADGPLDKLTFKVWKVTAATQEAKLQILDKDGKVMNNGDFTYAVGDLSSSEPNSPNREIDLANYTGAKKLKIYGSGTLNKYISNIKITQKAYLTASTSSVTMSSVKACEQATGQFDISYSDLSTLHLSQTNDNFTYEVWSGNTKLDGFDNDCGDYGTYTVKFFYTPQAKGDYSNVVTISASGKTQTITLSGTANKPNRTIEWDLPELSNVTATTSTELSSYIHTTCQESAGTVTYTISNQSVDGVATLEGNVLSFHKQGTVTIKASAVETSEYLAAPDVTKIWSVGLVGAVISKPTITSTITYGDDNSVVTWANDWSAKNELDNTIDVNGNIELVGPATFDAAGQTNLTFNFHPSDIYTYKPVEFTVPVTVQQATPSSTPSATAITYGAKVKTSTLSNSGTAGTWTWREQDKEQILSAGDHVLNVHFTPSNSNYSELDDVVTLTVNKATPNVTPQSTDIKLGEKISASTLSTKTGDVAGTWSWKDEDANTTPSAMGSINLYAVFTPDNKSNYNSIEALVSLTVGAPDTYTFTGNGDWSNDDNKWNTDIAPNPTTPVDVQVNGNVTISTEVTVKSLTIEEGSTVTVTPTGKLTLGSEDSNGLGDLRVEKGGQVVLGEGKMQVRNFTLEASLGGKDADKIMQAATSGQLDGSDKLTVNGDAFFSMTFDPRGKIDYGWYDFVVPFEVEVLNGIYDANGNKLTNNRDYIVMSYDEAKRAVKANEWVPFTGTMQPGRIYTIAFDDERDWNTFLFKRKSGSSKLSDGNYDAEYTKAGVSYDRGWNGLGNGTLQHMQLKDVDSETKIQMYNHSLNCYEPFDADEKAFAVGTAFFMQVGSTGETISLEAADGSKVLRAPKYDTRSTSEFRLSLTVDDEAEAADRLWVSASEEAVDEYTIGHDLIKMGTPTEAKTAQIWLPTKDLRLCDLEMPLVNNNASAPIAIFAPMAGTYTLDVERAPGNTTLFLTKEGRVFWNLSMSGYTFDLEKGTTSNYGLRLVVSAPHIATGTENIQADGIQGSKIIIDNQLYIITPQGAVYDALGHKVM